MVKFFFGLVKSVVFLCGIAFIAIFAVGFVEGFRKEIARQNEVKAELDTLIAEFIAIKPRATWPTLMSEVNDARLLDNFVEGAREGGAELTISQRHVARMIIIPRIKEQMARTVERFDPNIKVLEAKRMVAEMERDCERFMKRYKPVMVALLTNANLATVDL